jgi:hypothetical protein
VTLHRVADDGAGPLDSVRTDAGGRYAFRYTPTGSPDAIYFVSALYAGIAYFSPPLAAAVVRGDDAEIAVFDTTSREVPIRVRGRHLVVGAASPRDPDRRSVLEVYELSNDSSVTRVGARADDPTFAALVPQGTRDFAVERGDVSVESVRLVNGRVEVLAPLAPGLKQLAFAYTLPSRAFPMSLPAGRPIDVLEVLVEDAAATASGAGLREVDAVEIEGRRFRRFLAQDVAASAVARISVPTAAAVPRTAWLVAVLAALGAAMLFALARAFGRRRATTALPAMTREPPPDTPERLARVIADLDAEFERRGSPSRAERTEYENERSALKARLAAALARAEPVGEGAGPRATA